MIIPSEGMPAAEELLYHLQRVPHPDESQRRFEGALRKAMGHQSRNDLTKRKRK